MSSVLPGFGSVVVGSVLTWMTMGSAPPTAALRGAGFVIRTSCRAQARATGWDGLQTSVSAPWVLQGGLLTPRYLVHHRDMKENLKKTLKSLGKGLLGFPEANKVFLGQGRLWGSPWDSSEGVGWGGRAALGALFGFGATWWWPEYRCLLLLREKEIYSIWSIFTC